ncbi:MAG TPA: ATP-binding protein [Idiomarina baltica]|uniref:histidine kinase n=1 Tax=Idiomarina baltica TaxID=190892 RepID=A0A348WPF7_9GAMM|nr:ATP-binding protein [Idiomarina baltica]|tara:strand:- start:5229 stop:5909 length:681 start_codon:yes stop_codon:yes gene_type:complete
MSKPSIDFSTLLAVSVHDMKNSLGLLVQQLQDISYKVNDAATQNELAHMHYEAQRINTNLVHLLALYRQQDAWHIESEQVYVDEIIEELVMNNRFYSQHKAIEVDVELPEDIYFYGDRSLITQVLNDVVINAMRYTADKLIIKAQRVAERGCSITIEDNGPGYPESLLVLNELSARYLDMEGSRTGLGLYFARLIAQAHEYKGQQGYIKLENSSSLGGSRFTLHLP